MSNVIIIGGGAAGMMAGIAASENGHKVTLLEQNEKLGKKIYITGKGRCNFTNASDMEELFSQIVTNPKFLYSALYTFNNDMVMDFFQSRGMEYKIERGNRVFPVSDHASDVTNTLQRTLKANGVEIRLNTRVARIETSAGRVCNVVLENGKILPCDAVIVATGGFSYQTTGSTGDGYRFAKELHHHVTPRLPALVPFTTQESYIYEMQGLSLKNVSLMIKNAAGKLIYDEFGEMLFTHFGISGPLVLSASSRLAKTLDKERVLSAEIDLKPALSNQQLDERLLREIKENQNKQCKQLFSHLLPAKMVPVMIQLSGMDDEKKMNEITRGEREKIVHLLKHFPMTINGTRSFKEAIITQGGVSVKDVNPSTMESKLVHGLFFAGEVLDVDALTGGYNLQIAFSSGYLAGMSVE